MVADLRLQCLSALGASRTSPYLPTLFVGTLSSVPFGFGCISHTGTVSGALKATKSSVPFGFGCISHFTISPHAVCGDFVFSAFRLWVHLAHRNRVRSTQGD